jgi:hypothetical protein
MLNGPPPGGKPCAQAPAIGFAAGFMNKAGQQSSENPCTEPASEFLEDLA